MIDAPEGLEWELQANDDGRPSFAAELAPYYLFAWPNADGPGAWWWIGEDRDDCEDLVCVAEGDARTMAIAKADAEATGRSFIVRAAR